MVQKGKIKEDLSIKQYFLEEIWLELGSDSWRQNTSGNVYNVNRGLEAGPNMVFKGGLEVQVLGLFFKKCYVSDDHRWNQSDRHFSTNSNF